MDISIIPGATVAVVRIKINACSDNNTTTYWKLCYRVSGSESQYHEISDMYYGSPGIYGFGPMFYDLCLENNSELQPETTYDIKLVITGGDAYEINTYVEKQFTTCGKGYFEFKNVSEIDDTSAFRESTKGNGDQYYTFENFQILLDWFKKCMIDIGYNYKTTETNSHSPFNDEKYFSAAIYADIDQLTNQGAAGTSTYKSAITLGYLEPNEENKSAFIHEYRHFLGLDAPGINYHSTGSSGTFTYNYPNFCDKVTEVTSFMRGVDNKDMEIYTFYGENAVDSEYYKGSHYLGFMLLKALGLNDIHIVYNEYPTYYDYEINVSPSNINNISYTWYEKDDNDNLVSIENEINNTIHTTLETIWVKVTADGYEDQTVELNKDKLTETIELQQTHVNVTVSSMINKDISSGGVGSEDVSYLTMIQNDANKKINYNIAKVNSSLRWPNQIFILNNQIDIDDDPPYSVFITNKKGYTTGKIPSSTDEETYSVSSDYSNDTTFTIGVGSNTNAQHTSCIRAIDEYCSFSNVHIIPYSHSNIIKNIKLLGACDGAATIDKENKEIWFYENDIYADVEPTRKKTFYPTIGYEENILKDSDEMLEDVQFYFDETNPRLYSYLTFTVLPNDLERLRVGFVNLMSADYGCYNLSVNGGEPEHLCCYIDSIIQESDNVRIAQYQKEISAGGTRLFITVYNAIDLSNPISIPITQRTKSYTLSFMTTNDLINRINVTDFNGNIINPTSSKVAKSVDTYSIKYTFNSEKYENGYYNDGFIIEKKLI